MNRRICLIYNFAQHYRTNIFTLMDKELPIDFIFGDKHSDVKKMDYSLLNNFKKEVKNRTFIKKPLTFQSGIIPLLKDYSTFIMLGDLHCVSTWIMLIMANFSKRKIYLWSHGWYGRESAIKTIIKKVFFSLASGTFLYGNFARQLMIKEGLKESKLHVIYNSLCYDEQIKIRKELRPSTIYRNYFKNDFYNLVFIGRLTDIKRLDLLLMAIAALKLQYINVNLTIIGNGTKKEELTAQSKQLGLKRVWFYGECYNEKELSDLIYNADLCVSPGNVGLTAIHAMMYGTPVLTHNDFPNQMPEFEAIIDGVTGLFFEYEDSDSLAENIKRWFTIAPERDYVREKCFEVIDTKYNPHVQLETLQKYLL